MARRLTNSIFLAAFISALLCGVGLAFPDDPLKEKVVKLVQRLKTSPSDAMAEWELLQLGPEALPALHSLGPVPDAVKERLATVTATLEELRPKTWTVAKTQMPLAQALDQVKKQTGEALVDRRQSPVGVQVTVDFKSAPYWEIADSLARQADARLALYQPDGRVALVDGPAPPVPVFVHGPFRVAVKGAGARAQFDTQTRVGALNLEIAWEPRFQPFLIEAGPMSLRAKSAEAAPFVAEVHAHGPVFVHERIAKEFEVLHPAAPRSAAVLDEITGQFVVTMPSKQLEFKFKPIAVDKPQAEPGGVKVSVTHLTIDPDRWTIQMTFEVPAAGPKLESFQGWLGSRTWLDRTICHLDRVVDAKRQELQPDPLRTQVVSASATRAVVRYEFTNPDGAALKDFTSWRMICHVPGRLVELQVPFQFKKVELP
jgi:hypothetical protein